jgi:hypothetical protein
MPNRWRRHASPNLTFAKAALAQESSELQVLRVDLAVAVLDLAHLKSSGHEHQLGFGSEAAQ